MHLLHLVARSDWMLMVFPFLGVALALVYNSGFFVMSTWIPFLWSLIQILVVMAGSYSTITTILWTLSTRSSSLFLAPNAPKHLYQQNCSLYSTLISTSLYLYHEYKHLCVCNARLAKNLIVKFARHEGWKACSWRDFIEFKSTYRFTCVWDYDCRGTFYVMITCPIFPV